MLRNKLNTKFAKSTEKNVTTFLKDLGTQTNGQTSIVLETKKFKK